jgi:hypothetical protein
VKVFRKYEEPSYLCWAAAQRTKSSPTPRNPSQVRTTASPTSPFGPTQPSRPAYPSFPTLFHLQVDPSRQTLSLSPCFSSPHRDARQRGEPRRPHGRRQPWPPLPCCAGAPDGGRVPLNGILTARSRISKP